jgi:hypothetical protein
MSPRKKKIIIGGLVIGGVLFAGAQLVPVQGIGSNPPERFKIDAPPEVEAVLRRACFDCHSNETRWPLYSRIAPGSWLMARDVKNGRQHLNFSKWGDVDDDERLTDMENCWDQVAAGEMPKWFYVYPMHLSARLSDADKALLKGWVDGAKAKAAKKDEAKVEAKGEGKAAKKEE